MFIFTLKINLRIRILEIPGNLVRTFFTLQKRNITGSDLHAYAKNAFQTHNTHCRIKKEHRMLLHIYIYIYIYIYKKKITIS